MGYAIVVGCINIDLWGRSFRPLTERDSNPGEIRCSMGGVGRNIAHNMRLLGMDVKLLTAIADDRFERDIDDSCTALGLDISGSARVKGGSNGCYMFISGPDGDMRLAVSDMSIAESITPELIDAQLDMLCGAELIVIDGNLRADTIERIASRVSAPIFADPVSAAKARSLALHLDKLYAVKPNGLEARTLTGEADPLRAAAALHAAGVRRAYVTAGAGGLAVAAENRCFTVPAMPCALVNATGGGDAFMAALCRAYTDGLDAEASARFALAAGALAVECAETINPAMSLEAVRRRLETYNSGGKDE